MASKVEELRKQAALIAEQLAAAEAEALESGFTKIEKICADYEISVEQLATHFGFGGKAKKASTGVKAVRASPAPKYRLPTGETWSGRGKPSRPIQAMLDKGHKLEEFLIK